MSDVDDSSVVKKGVAVIVVVFLVLFGISAYITDFFSEVPFSDMDEKQENFSEVELVEVVDGDTVIVKYEGEDERVCLRGVDAPEIHRSENLDEWHGIKNESWLHKEGKRSKKLLEVILEDDLRISYFGDKPVRDGYERMNVYVYLDNGTEVGKFLLKKGYARVKDDEEFRRKPRYLEIEESAMENKTGIWSAPSFSMLTSPT